MSKKKEKKYQSPFNDSDSDNDTLFVIRIYDPEDIEQEGRHGTMADAKAIANEGDEVTIEDDLIKIKRR